MVLEFPSSKDDRDARNVFQAFLELFAVATSVALSSVDGLFFSRVRQTCSSFVQVVCDTIMDSGVVELKRVLIRLPNFLGSPNTFIKGSGILVAFKVW